MSPEEIPDSLIAILDKRAGKKHSRTGPVVACLAEILTEYDRLMKSFDRSMVRNPLALLDDAAEVMLSGYVDQRDELMAVMFRHARDLLLLHGDSSIAWCIIELLLMESPEQEYNQAARLLRAGSS